MTSKLDFLLKYANFPFCLRVTPLIDTTCLVDRFQASRKESKGKERGQKHEESPKKGLKGVKNFPLGFDKGFSNVIKYFI